MLYFVFFLLLLGKVVSAVDPWSFVVLADWHGAEAFAVGSNNEDLESYQEARKIFKQIREHHSPELMILPGDTQTGHWDQPWFKEYLQNMTGMIDATTNDTILVAAENVYSTTKQLFTESGFIKVLVAFGDHEIGKRYW